MIRVGDSAGGTKRIKSSISQLSDAKRVTNIHDLPESILIEILCRLPSYEYIARCKCVSKSWCTLMSNFPLIRQFVCLQSDDGNKQPPVVRTLINKTGWEFLNRLSSSCNPLARLFEKLMTAHHLEKEPIVVGTYNDLVLCHASPYQCDYFFRNPQTCRQSDYFICNPHTCQWVTLPRPPQLYRYSSVGFICDLLYFQYKGEKGQFIQFNPQYRCRVVLLIIDSEKMLISEFTVLIFSSETGEWTERTVLIPSPILSCDFLNSVSHSYNGMLYWHGCNVLIGVDPFMITTTPPADDHYTCRVIELVRPDDEAIHSYFRGVNRGCLQLLEYSFSEHALCVWELNEDDVSAEPVGNYYLQERVTIYELEWDMLPEDENVSYRITPLAFDPNNDGTLYVHLHPIPDPFYQGVILTYNIHTGEWSEIDEDSSFRLRDDNFFPLVRQCWPTPVPKLPPNCESGCSYSGS